VARAHFPHQESALKLLFLAIRQASKKWTMPVKNWPGQGDWHNAISDSFYADMQGRGYLLN
jgi:hypothetical protein